MRRDLVAQLVVEAVDRARLGAQHGVAELADVLERRTAPRGRLGIQGGRRLRVLFELFVVLGHGSDASCAQRGAAASLLRVDVHAEKATALWALGATDLADRGVDLIDRGRRSAALTTTWLRSLPRSRKSGAGPSGSGSARLDLRCRGRRCAAPTTSRAQTIRISVENGG